MSSTITSIGGGQQIWNLGNNMINVGNFVELEMQALEMRKTPYNNQKKALTDEKAIYASMKKEFGNFIQMFKDMASFKGNEKATTMSQDGFMTVKASSSAIAGTYTVTVEQIAERHQITTDPTKKINLDDKVGVDDTFKINGKDVQVTKDMTYKDLINKINNGNYGTSAYSLGGQIFLSSTTAGESGQIKLTDGSTKLLENIGLVTSAVNGDGTNVVAHEVTKAKNAEYTINGIKETSTSNIIESLPGVTINLEKVTTEPIKLTIQDSDVQGSIDMIKKMKDEYNKAVSNLDLYAGENGVMQGSNVAFSIQNAMTSIFSYNKDDTYLSSFGIQVDKTGIMTLDEEKLKTAFKENAEGTKQFFFGLNGIGYEMEKKLDKIFGDQGFIGERSKSIDDQVRDIDSKLATIDALNKVQQEAVIAKYSKLESDLAALNSQLQMIQAMTKTEKDD